MRVSHIIALFTAFLLFLSPVDCFSQRLDSQPEKECCKQRKCSPAKQASDCCKIKLFADTHYAEAASKPSTETPLLIEITTALSSACEFHPPELTLARLDLAVNVHAPPGDGHQLSLPLLI